MTLTSFEFLPHACSVFEGSVLTISSNLLMLNKSEMSRFLIINEIFLMNDASSSLFFTIENLNELMFFSAIGMETVRGV